MRVLVDTNILVRLSLPRDPAFAATVSMLDELSSANAELCISSQTIYEFLAVATRPLEASGLAMAQSEADRAIAELVDGMTILYDSPSVVTGLRRLVVAYGVTGKSIHDARLVATMLDAGISHILTINSADFRRYADITVIDPRTTFQIPGKK